MKSLKTFFHYAFMICSFLCAAAVGLLLLAVEWMILSESFWQVFNPLRQLLVILELLTMPGFWVFAIVGVCSFMLGSALAPEGE